MVSKKSQPWNDNSQSGHLVIPVEYRLDPLRPCHSHGIEFQILLGKEVVVEQIVQSLLDLLDPVCELDGAQRSGILDKRLLFHQLFSVLGFL